LKQFEAGSILSWAAGAVKESYGEKAAIFQDFLLREKGRAGDGATRDVKRRTMERLP
jgi:hypothetical protein